MDSRKEYEFCVALAELCNEYNIKPVAVGAHGQEAWIEFQETKEPITAEKLMNDSW